MRHLKYGIVAAFCVVLALGAGILMGQDNSAVAPEALLLNEKQGIASNTETVTPVATPVSSGDELPAELGGASTPAPVAAAPAAVVPVVEKATPAGEALPAELAPVPQEVATPKVLEAPAEEGVAPAPAGETLPAELAPETPKEVPVPADKGVAPVVEATNVPAPEAGTPVVAPASEKMIQPVVGVATVPVTGEVGLQPSDRNTEYFKGRAKVAETLAAQEEVRRKANAEEAKKFVEKADTAFKNKDYETAYTNYVRIQSAFKSAPDTPENREILKRAQKNIPISQFEIVKALAKENKNLQAVETAKNYLLENPDNQPLAELDKKLEKKIAESKPETGSEKPVQPGVTPVGANKTDVQLLLKAGKDYMSAREFDKAKSQFEAVLALEPANKDAIKYLGEVARRRMKSGLLERESTSKGMVADVTKTWNPPDYKEIKPPPPVKSTSPDSQAQAIIKKMSEINIPEIEFRQANIHDVVEFLNKASMEGDKTAAENGPRGINIILKIKDGAAAQPAAGGDAPSSFPGGEGAGEAGATSAGGVPPITFTARYISLAEALNIITSVAGLKYRVEGRVVMVVDGSDEPRDMILRMYPVEPTFNEKLTTMGPMRALGAGTAPGGGGGDFVSGDTSGGGAAAGSGEDLKQRFIGMGVPFPPGSSIQYNAGIGQVIVANTSENLTKFEALLSVLNVIPAQVEIEARFVEINETELEELGVEWLLTDNWEMLQKKNTAFGTPMSATERIQMNANSADNGFTKGLRFWGNSSSGDAEPVSGGNNGRLLSISSILTNPELTFVLHALEQKGHADVLSAPKVTTRSGVEASIRVVTEFIYPTTFDVQSGSDAGNNNNGAVGAAVVQQNTFVSIPQDFETREVGVILTVLPEVSPNGGTINLTMTPQVVTEPTWQQYGSVIRHADGTEDVLNMPQPFFHTRTLTTQISIYDGATVVMGGLITETLTTVDDKIPLLGDIPLLGYLFKTSSQKSEKKNLLIFVTASLVDPGGKRIKKSEDLGTALMGPAKPATPASPAP